MSRTMVYRRREAYMIVVHTRDPPSDAEWEAYVRDGERWLSEVAGCLILTEGGGPRAAQRRMMKVALLAAAGENVRTCPNEQVHYAALARASASLNSRA